MAVSASSDVPLAASIVLIVVSVAGLALLVTLGIKTLPWYREQFKRWRQAPVEARRRARFLLACEAGAAVLGAGVGGVVAHAADASLFLGALGGAFVALAGIAVLVWMVLIVVGIRRRNGSVTHQRSDT
jgi:hypothetical protein